MFTKGRIRTGDRTRSGRPRDMTLRQDMQIFGNNLYARHKQHDKPTEEETTEYRNRLRQDGHRARCPLKGHFLKHVKRRPSQGLPLARFFVMCAYRKNILV